MFLFSLLIVTLTFPPFVELFSSQPIVLAKENESIMEYSARMVSFYQLKEGEKWRDVTEEVLSSPDTSATAKYSICTYLRRLIIFEYPSDHLLIKGFISFTPQPDHHPLIVLFRWGNQKFALMNPGADIANYGDYTVVSSALRGGVSAGKDEFGGADIHDMKNLINFLPQLAEELGINLPKCMYMLGPSRGGLEMFLTLAYYPELQNRVTKVVALSAILDLHRLIQDRPNDMKRMFRESFGLPSDSAGEEAWINKRDPLKTIPFLKKSLPILIIQGTKDPRINLMEGYHMVHDLQKSGHSVDYWEVPEGNHILANVPHLMDHIIQWLDETHGNLDCRDRTYKHQAKVQEKSSKLR